MCFRGHKLALCESSPDQSLSCLCDMSVAIQQSNGFHFLWVAMSWVNTCSYVASYMVATKFGKQVANFASDVHKKLFVLKLFIFGKI